MVARVHFFLTAIGKSRRTEDEDQSSLLWTLRAKFLDGLHRTLAALLKVAIQLIYGAVLRLLGDTV